MMIAVGLPSSCDAHQVAAVLHVLSSFQVTRAQRQTDESLLELDQQRKETAKVQQASNDELDKVRPLGGAAAVSESAVLDE